MANKGTKKLGTKKVEKSVYEVDGLRLENAKPKDLWVSLSVKVSTRPYENMDFSVGMSLTLDDGADVNSVRDSAMKWCSDYLAKNIIEVRKKYNDSE